MFVPNLLPLIQANIQTAGGAVETGLTAVQALCKEADEECGYSSDLVRKYAK